MGLRADLTNRPPREQAARLADVAEPLVSLIARHEPDAGEARAALAAIQAWTSGQALTGRSFSDLVYSEDEQGLLRQLSRAAGKPAEDAWNALTTATLYVAWLVYRETGEPMPSDVNEVDADTLDLLDEQLGERA